jgi:hypothetical protein
VVAPVGLLDRLAELFVGAGKHVSDHVAPVALTRISVS